MTLGPRCTFVPPFLLERIAASDHAAADHCRATLARDQEFRAGRETLQPATAVPAAGSPAWVVDTAANGSTLPGRVVRAAGQAASGDASVDEAAVGITATLSLYADVYDRASYDGQGAEVVLTVHYEQGYDNAFWNGTQLVFGDGDGKIFGSFTKPIDVLGHEFTHAVTQFTANLTYQGQSGALNESVSDCFGMCVKQRVLGQTAAQADWLVGEGIFLPGIHARALRDMANPGTAYDDPTLGRDPQVGSMSDYVDTTDDNGGVHTNSGIPNRAFQLAATAIGGDTWDGAGRIWYAALTGSGVTAGTDFAGFAAATVAAAGDHADAVRQAWTTVGVTPGAGATTAASPSGSAAGQVLRVRRTGGIAGRTVEGSVDLSAQGATTEAARSLVDRIDLSAVAEPEGSLPDAFSYTFEYAGRCVTVPRHRLTDDQRALAALVLEPGDTAG
ncbi:M4 family metallopeptidase [Nocardioides cynanchi]|uniref:M4 family metallopeptidase n=1 Tax=Nocardioides cynanchi TaxID=2558918 RepID=UPI00124853E7|nr:M4 family metallopeptidase [Nocardioides cynanchi]